MYQENLALINLQVLIYRKIKPINQPSLERSLITNKANVSYYDRYFLSLFAFCISGR